MHPSIPCPNPVCTQSFSPDAVKGVASLVCPRCGTVFQFRPAGAAAPRRTPPPAAVPVAVPVPKAEAPPAKPAPTRPAVRPAGAAVRPARTAPPPPVAPAPPLAVPVAPDVSRAAPGLDFQSQPEMVVPRTKRRSPRRGFAWGRALVLLLVGGLGAAGVVWGVVWLRRLPSRPEEGGGPAGPAVLKDYNCDLKLPGLPWKDDSDIKSKLHVNLAMSRSGPRSHLGLFLKDYKTRTPTQGELVEEALGKLRAYLGTVEYELKPASDAARLGGRPALLVEFAGTDPEQVTVAGEVIILAHLGYAYWLFTWCPEDDRDKLAPEWQDLRKGFALLGGREGWKERPRQTETVQGVKGAYRLTFPSDLWKKNDMPEDFDAQADLVLEAHEPEPGGKPHASKAAHFIVFVLPKVEAGQAAAAAREHLKKRLEAEGKEKATLTPVKEKGGIEADRDADIGALKGHLVKLQVTTEGSSSYERFMVLASVPRPDGLLILLGDCDWNRRDFWEHEYQQVLKGLKGR